MAMQTFGVVASVAAHRKLTTAWVYDDIGNRTAAEGRDYVANNLNQYTAIDAFAPTYDLDGNQTAVLTETGVWQVQYNAENRPVRWTQGSVVVTMGYDRLGRRVFHKEMNGNRQVTYTKFLYDGYLCIQQLFSNSPWNVYKEFIWDPTEPVATRPLCFRQYGQRSAFLLHDGNKNVTDVVTVGPFNEPVAHYDYAPFGAPAASGPRAADNPFRFSSEFHDPTLALVYYNYRHYNPKDGRWLGRDMAEDFVNDYLFCGNYVALFDSLGLWTFSFGDDVENRRYKGHITGPGWAADWGLSWNLVLNGEQSADDPCVIEAEGTFSTVADAGITVGYSWQPSWRMGKYNVWVLLGARGFTSIQASSKVSVRIDKCDLASTTLNTSVSASWQIGLEGGALLRLYRQRNNAKKPLDTKTFGAGVRASASFMARVALGCSGETCTLSSGFDIGTVDAEAFVNLHFFDLSFPWETDLGIHAERGISFRNPLLSVLDE